MEIISQMTVDHSPAFSHEDELDLREVFAALMRRWRWAVSGAVLGLTLATTTDLIKPRAIPRAQMSILIDVAQGPCLSRNRKLIVYKNSSVSGGECIGEIDTMKSHLNWTAKNVIKDKNHSVQIGEKLSYSIKDFSSTQLILELTAPASLSSKLESAATTIQNKFSSLVLNDARRLGIDTMPGENWLHSDGPILIKASAPALNNRKIVFGFMVGLVLGAGSGLIFDLRSSLIYSQQELLRRLGYPLRLVLPADSWTSPVVQVWVAQFASQLESGLSWRVLSIAHQHDAVAPLTQLLQENANLNTKFKTEEPLLSAVFPSDFCDTPTGILLVVQAGFNSSRALEEAHLQISQMSGLKAVGVVLIGASLPLEFTRSTYS